MAYSNRVTSRRILLGRIQGAYGIRGAVLIRTFTAEPQGIAAYGALEDESGQRTFTLEVVRVTPRGVICRIAGIDDRTHAEELKGVELHVPRERLPQLEAGEYYHEDLIGLEAIDESGALLGNVVAVANYGAGDFLEIQGGDKRRSELVPMLAAYILNVDLDQGRIVIKLPEVVEAGDQGGGGAER